MFRRNHKLTLYLYYKIVTQSMDLILFYFLPMTKVPLMVDRHTIPISIPRHLDYIDVNNLLWSINDLEYHDFI